MPRAIRFRIDKEPLPRAGRLHVLVGRHAPALAPLFTRLARRLPRRLRIRLYAQSAYTNLRLFSEGDGRAGMAIYHPDVEFYAAPHWAQFSDFPRRVVGRDALLRWVEEWSAIFDEVDYRQLEVIDLGDKLVGRWSLSGTVRGLTTSIESGQVVRLAPDGRVIEQREYTWPDAVAAAGLPPEVAR